MPAPLDLRSTTSDVYYDPYDVDINADPYPVFKRLREEAPLYYNEEYDFFAVSRFDDVERGLRDRDTFISGPGRRPRADQGRHRDAAGDRASSRTRRRTPSTAACCRGCSHPSKVAALEPQMRKLCADAWTR